MTAPTIPTAPILGHVEGVELVDTGTWAASTGPFTATPDMLASAVAALDCPAVRRPVLKAGHGGAHGVGEPALGYIDNLRIANEGHTLVGDYRGMPGWLTDVDPNGQSVLASAYPDRSIEGEAGYRCQLGHEHPFVVHAVALLGVERPAVGTLQSLQELYGVAATVPPSPGGTPFALTVHASQEPAMPQPVSAAATTDDVRRAYYSGPGADWDLWVREMYVDPPELIVDNDADGSILRVPYMVAADGAVTFSDPQPVKVTYVAARAASPDDRRVTFASRAESRPGTRPAASTAPPTPTATPAEGPTTPPEGAGMTPEQLRENLGLPADASQIEVAAALAAAGHIPTAPDAPTPTQAPAPTSLPVAASAAGVVQIDEAALNELRQQAAAGAAARAQQETEQRTRTVDAAVADGRIPPARRDHWLSLLAADPGADTVLASLKPGLAVPTSEIGHGTDSPPAADDGWFPQYTPAGTEA